MARDPALAAQLSGVNDFVEKPGVQSTVNVVIVAEHRCSLVLRRFQAVLEHGGGNARQYHADRDFVRGNLEIPRVPITWSADSIRKTPIAIT